MIFSELFIAREGRGLDWEHVAVANDAKIASMRAHRSWTVVLELLRMSGCAWPRGWESSRPYLVGLGQGFTRTVVFC